MQLGIPFSITANMRRRINRFWAEKFSNSDLQTRMAKWPLISRLARREGEEIFDLVMGFINSQVLFTLVKCGILESLRSGPKSIDQLAKGAEIPRARCEVLCRAGVALGLLKTLKNDMALTRKGAVLVGVPGLVELIEHHAILYRDLQDPVAFFKGQSVTELAQFWPYVFGQPQDEAPDVIERYSQLMSASLGLVAQDTLETVKIGAAQSWVDIGGGSGGFITQVTHKYPELRPAVFDLPHTQGGSEHFERFEGSFLTDPLPKGFDVMSFIRVLYDHSDETVFKLLTKAYNALPKNGQIIISEPMSGGETPNKSGDVYFSIYTLAMETGKARSQVQIADLLKKIGFKDIQPIRAKRPFVTSIVTAKRN